MAETNINNENQTAGQEVNPLDEKFSRLELEKVKGELEKDKEVQVLVEQDAITLQKISKKLGKSARMVFAGFAAMLASHLLNPNEANADSSKVAKVEMQQLDPEVKAYKNQLEFMLKSTGPMIYNGEDQMLKNYSEEFNKTMKGIEDLKNDNAKLKFLADLKNNAIPIFMMDEKGESPADGSSISVNEFMKATREIGDASYFDVISENKDGGNIAQKEHDIDGKIASIKLVSGALGDLSTQFASKQFLNFQVAQNGK